MAFRALTIISNVEEEERFSCKNQASSTVTPKVTLRKNFKAFIITLLDDLLHLTRDQQRIVFLLVFRCTVEATIENSPTIMPTSSSSSSSSSTSTLAVTVSDNVFIFLSKLGVAVNPKTRVVCMYHYFEHHHHHHHH